MRAEITYGQVHNARHNDYSCMSGQLIRYSAGALQLQAPVEKPRISDRSYVDNVGSFPFTPTKFQQNKAVWGCHGVHAFRIKISRPSKPSCCHKNSCQWASKNLLVIYVVLCVRVLELAEALARALEPSHHCKGRCGGITCSWESGSGLFIYNRGNNVSTNVIT